MTDREQYAPGPASGDHLDGREPADMFKRFASVRSLYG
jgi:hypothetical protein